MPEVQSYNKGKQRLMTCPGVFSHAVVLTGLVLVCIGSQIAGAQPINSDAEHSAPTQDEIWDKLETLGLGDSMLVVRRKLEPTWQPVLTNKYLKNYLISRRIPHTNSAAVAEWEARPKGSEHSPIVFFGIFSNAWKTNLIDGLYYSDVTVRPAVDGEYQKALHAVKKGDSVEVIFQRLGRGDCDYVKGDDGKWKVRLDYMGFKGEFITFEIDAATGTVLQVLDMTI